VGDFCWMQLKQNPFCPHCHSGYTQFHCGSRTVKHTMEIGWPGHRTTSAKAITDSLSSAAKTRSRNTRNGNCFPPFCWKGFRRMMRFNEKTRKLMDKACGFYFGQIGSISTPLALQMEHHSLAISSPIAQGFPSTHR